MHAYTDGMALPCLTLIQEINQECILAALQKMSPMQKVKCNVGYEEDDSEVEEAREDVKHMRINTSESP